MAQKRITELPLIETVGDTFNIPGDNTIQAYRATALKMYNYHAAKLAALAAVDPLAADFILGIDASDANALKAFSIGKLRNAAYRAVTTTDSVGLDDETMKLSGESFTSTLPTAVGVAGKRYKFIHAGTSFTQVYTLETTSGQTIGGVASGSYSLYTAGEVLEIESDGANWMIVGRIARASGTESWDDNWANTTTDIRWTRNGKKISIFGRSTLTGTPTNSGFSVTIPSKFTSAVSPGGMGDSVGDGIMHDNGSNNYPLVVVMSDTTSLSLYSEATNTGSTSWRSNTTTIPFTWVSGDYMTFQADWDVTGWQD